MPFELRGQLDNGLGYSLPQPPITSSFSPSPSLSSSRSLFGKSNDLGLDSRVSFSKQPGEAQAQYISRTSPKPMFQDIDIRKTIDNTDPQPTPAHRAMITLQTLIKQGARNRNLDYNVENVFVDHPADAAYIKDLIEAFNREKSDKTISAINKAISTLCGKLVGPSIKSELRGGRKTFTRKYKNRKYKVSSKSVRKSSHKRNTYRNKRHSRRH
jgi:hypothetical protein